VAERHVKEARIHLAKRRLDKAALACGAALRSAPLNQAALRVTEQVMKALVARKPGDLDARVHLAQALFAQSKFLEAADAAWDGWQLDPSHDALRTLAAKAYKRALDVLETERRRKEVLLRSVELDPNDGSAHVRIATYLLLHGSLDEAADHYRSALRVDPANGAAKEGLKRVLAAKSGAFPGQPSADERRRLPVQQRLPWTLLPRGHLPWERLERELRPIFASHGRRPATEIPGRLQLLSRMKPDFTAVGEEGFEGYVVFAFEETGVYILESIFYGNATYVLGGDWEALCRKTKGELLDRHLHKARIFHTKNWESRMRRWLPTNW